MGFFGRRASKEEKAEIAKEEEAITIIRAETEEIQTTLRLLAEDPTIGAILLKTEAEAEFPMKALASLGKLRLQKPLSSIGEGLVRMALDKDFLKQYDAGLSFGRALGAAGRGIMLIPLLKAKSERLRCTASAGLSEAKDKGTVEPLIELLRDGDPLVRYHAARILGDIKDQRAAKSLVAVLEGDDTESVRKAAITSLGEIGDPGAIQPLTEALNDKSKEIQKAAKEALKRMNETRRLFSTLE